MPFGACFAGAAGASAAGVDGCVVQPASSVDLVDPKPATCTCPNERMNCSANANTAHQAPNRAFARNQRIVGVYSLTLSKGIGSTVMRLSSLPSPVLRRCDGGATVVENCDV